MMHPRRGRAPKYYVYAPKGQVREYKNLNAAINVRDDFWKHGKKAYIEHELLPSGERRYEVYYTR